MKMFSGFLIVTVALASLPRLNAAPYQSAILKLLAKSIANQDQSYPTYGLSTVGCPQDMLQLNPVLYDLQAYGSHFGMEVDCSSDLCTELTINKDGKPFNSKICSDSLQPQLQGTPL